jgi:MoxR-like ATPase
LLTVLNERVYRRGAETHRLPMLSLFAASNHLPEEEALRALFDRFLLRCHVDNLRREAMPRLLSAGWALEAATALPATVSAEDLRNLSRRIYSVDLTAISERYAELVFRIRDLGVALSDRRAVKVMKLLAASALLCGRAQAEPSDFWVLRYVWDREEQIDPLASLVNGVLKEVPADAHAHALARTPETVDGDELARQLDAAEKELNGERRTLAELARLREHIADLADRAAWVADEAGRKHLVGRAGTLLQKIG